MDLDIKLKFFLHVSCGVDPCQEMKLASNRSRTTMINTWSRAQSKALGGADDVGSTVEQARPHLTEQAGYAGERGRPADKTRATSSSGQDGRNDGLLIPL